MTDRLTTRNEHGDAMLCDRLQGIGICLNDDVECVAQYEDELEARRWISVEERLPEDDMAVLVIAYGQIENITLRGAYQLATHYESDGFVLSEFPLMDDVVVTHWMPLPEPPEVKQ